MIKYIFFGLLMILFDITYGQSVELSNELVIHNNTESNPEVGTMRWTGVDFELRKDGKWISLTGYNKIGTMIGNNGIKYTTVRIGYQEWMLENLRSTKLNDGTSIAEVQDSVLWSTLDTMAWCHYGNIADNELEYGKLYNWFTINSGRLCPDDWQVGSMADWQKLIEQHGSMSNSGVRMKQAGTEHWNSSPNPGINERGFSGIGGGYRKSNGDFSSLKFNGYWWSSEALDATNAWFYILGFNNQEIQETAANKTQGLSVRCFRNI